MKITIDMKKLTYLLILVLAVALTSCHTSRKGISQSAVNIEAQSQYEAMLGQSFDFAQLQGKVKYSLGSKNLSGKLTIEQGKRLAMTMTVLGAEVARLEATQEEVFLVEKLDKVYARLSIAEVASALGLQDEACYDALESLLLGRLFIPGKGYAKASHFGQLHWNQLDEQGHVQGVYSSDNGYRIRYTIDADNHLCLTQVEVLEKGSSFSWGYADFQPVGEKGTMPGTEQLRGVMGDKDISLQFAVTNPQLTKKGISPFNPEGYKEVTVTELLSIIKNLR